MEDFIFGSFASDELKFLHARVAARGLQHKARIAPLDPLPDEPVTLIVTVGPTLELDHLACYYTTDGQEPEGSRGMARVGHVMPLERVAVEWHAFLWGYVERWECTLPPQPEGTRVRYCIGGWRDRGDCEDEVEIFADWPPVQQQIEQATVAFFAGRPQPEPASFPVQVQPTPFAYSVDRQTPPDWARTAVVYQVFVDRFNPGGGRPFAQPGSLRDFHGGTLSGVTEKLDYIADLGATCIWLSPVFASPTCHGYDTTDFYTVDPRWGSNDDLRELVQEAHARNIRVLLDLVCNHVSVQHPFFQDALADPDSPYRSWFTFDAAYPHGYRTFFTVASMPRLNTDHSAVRDYLIEVAHHWLTEYDVDGFRLDHANGPSHAFWTEFWAACKAVKPECWCFGEIVEPPPVLSRYTGRLDGCLDFHLCDMLRRTFGRGTWHLCEMERALARHERFFPSNFARPSFLDNHDMNRFLYMAEGDRQLLRLAALVQMTLPGPPVVYYGTEVGLSQNHDRGDGRGLEVARLPMLWGNEQDPQLLTWYRRLIEIRRSHPAIWQGERTTLHVDEAIWVYVLEGEGGPLIVALNNSPHPQDLSLDVARMGLDEGTVWSDLLEGGEAFVREGRLELVLLPWSGGVWEAK